MAFATAAGAALMATSAAGPGWQAVWWLTAAAGILLRLAANMLDGMVALGQRRSSRMGAIYNEAPDRASDVIILIGAGYAAGSVAVLGYWAAIVALLVTYVRALGASAGAGQVFAGPMAKPHRMFVIAGAAVFAALAPTEWTAAMEARGIGMMSIALGVVVFGGVLTLVVRLRRIADALRE